MHLIIASTADRASTSMSSYILDNVSFKEEGDNTFIHGDYRLKIIEERHLNFDTVPQSENGVSPEVTDITFLSSHSSSAEIKSLTVHPTGNFADAKLGGKARTLARSSPETMTPALRMLWESYGGDGFEITLESTHHGPCIEIPNYYIEIGTTEKEWKDRSALEAVKEAVFSDSAKDSANFVGVGGGHYMPKVTKYALNNEINVGHLISKHDHDIITREQIEEAVDKTGNCRGFIMDRKGSRGPVRAMIKEIADDRNLEIIKL